MTILSACQSAAVRLIGTKPSSIFSSAAKFELELSELVQECATDIAKAYDWQVLTVFNETVGDGASIAFPLPTDFDRFPIKGDIHSANWQTMAFVPVLDKDRWIDLQTFQTSGTPGHWIILGGKLQIYPAISDTEKARYYYLSNLIVADKNGAAKAKISADDDVFRLDERLLTLSLIWRWRAQKRLEYAEDMKNYEVALAQISGRDSAKRILTVGRQRQPWDASAPYPGVIRP